MSLITQEDLISAAGLSRAGILKKPIARGVMNLTKIDEVNALYDKVKDLQGNEFFDTFLRELGIQYVVFEEDLTRIPAGGAFIVVANHPLGAIDGVLMTKIFSDARPDFKIMGNFLLQKIQPMADYVIPVNPFESRKDAFSSTSGMRATLRHLQNGGCVGIFPAGEVSNKNNAERELRDREWQKAVLKMIKTAGVPVVPMYFHAENSRIFYRMARLHPDLQTLMLPAEMMRKRGEPVRIRIGRAVSAKNIEAAESAGEIEELLRKKIYLLKAYYERRRKIRDLLKLPNLRLNFHDLSSGSVVQNIISETPREDLRHEIQALRRAEKLLFANGSYEVYFAEYGEIPSIMREIGRQRELTFREVGEGSNLPFDLDEYDQHYRHLFLWDNEAEKIAGAYRMGLGREIMAELGIKGFYTASLFDFDSELKPFFHKTIEMGRAYILKEYQQKPLPLFLLWRGIVYVCLRNPDHHFLMGGVSISNKFSSFSKALMIEFMRSNYYDSALAQYVHPKNEYRIKMDRRDRNLFLQEIDTDLNKLDKIIDDLEPGMRMPVLIKKYIKQNAKVIAFNVDPSFSDAIDGLMYIRISDLPESTIKPVLEELSNKPDPAMSDYSSGEQSSMKI